MEENIFLYSGKKRFPAKKIECKGCKKELIIRKNVRHGGYCNKCWPKINKGGHGDIASLETRRLKSEPFLKECPNCHEKIWLNRKPNKIKICTKCAAKNLSWKKNNRPHPRLGTGKPKEEIRKNKNLYTNKIKRDRKKILIEYFGNKCNLCGKENFPICVYEFHHVNPNEKIDRISNMLTRVNFEKIWLEIKKCIMVCSNCHKIIHHGDEKLS